MLSFDFFFGTGYYGTVGKLSKRTPRVGRPAALQSTLYRTLGQAQTVRFGEVPVLKGQKESNIEELGPSLGVRFGEMSVL